MDDRNVRFSGFKAFISGLIGTFIGSCINFFFEFRDGNVNILISAICGLLIIIFFMIMRGRVTGFKEMILMILGVIIVLIVYEIMISALYIYEMGKPVNLSNFLAYMDPLSYKMKAMLNTLLRGMPAVLIIILYSAIMVDPVVWNRNQTLY